MLAAAAVFFIVLPAFSGALVALQRRFEKALFTAVLVMVAWMLAYALLAAVDVGIANLTALIQLTAAMIGFLVIHARGKGADRCETFRMPFANGDPI